MSFEYKSGARKVGDLKYFSIASLVNGTTSPEAGGGGGSLPMSSSSNTGAPGLGGGVSSSIASMYFKETSSTFQSLATAQMPPLKSEAIHSSPWKDHCILNLFCASNLILVSIVRFCCTPLFARSSKRYFYYGKLFLFSFFFSFRSQNHFFRFYASILLLFSELSNIFGNVLLTVHIF